MNWTGQAIVCPRGRVGELSNWPESKRPGVYLLFGDDPDSSRPLAYIGETENVQDRLKQHVASKEFWDRVVFFTSKDDNLTKSHVKYLESRMVQLARVAKRVTLENGTDPTESSLPRADRDAMEEFLEPARILLGSLGFNLLEPVRPQGKTEEAKSVAGVQGLGPLSSTTLTFEVGKSGVKATGVSNDEGFVVLEGSVGPLSIRDSLNEGWTRLRMSLLDEGKAVADGEMLRFTEDVLFKSPSAAAAIVCGGNRNGRQAWRDANGKSLADLEEALLDDDGYDLGEAHNA
jgi:hypothetical protein